MSNRFRKLKLTQTLNHGFSINPSVSFPEESTSLFDCTMKATSQSDNSGNHDTTAAWATKNKANGKNSQMHTYLQQYLSQIVHGDIDVQTCKCLGRNI